MSDIDLRLGEDLKHAMREKNTLALNTLRALKSAIKYAAIEKGGAEAVLDDAEAMAVVRREVKKRQDSFQQFESAGRTDLSEKEQAEIEILERYLPQAMELAELEALIDAAIQETGATSRKEMGAVMKLVQERSAGRADNKVISQTVMGKLG